MVSMDGRQLTGQRILERYLYTTASISDEEPL